VYALGLSLGGLLALALAEQRPVSGLVVLAVPLELGRIVRTGVPWLHRIVRHLPKTPAIRDPEARLRHPGYDRMPLRAVNELLQLARQVRARLAEVTAPAQLIFSRLDPTVAPANAELLQRELGPGERELVWLERSGHVLPVDFDRALVAERVVAFLRRLEKA
jgi:carboxylesterase